MAEWSCADPPFLIHAIGEGSLAVFYPTPTWCTLTLNELLFELTGLKV